jgi:hypothetical protein
MKLGISPYNQGETEGNTRESNSSYYLPRAEDANTILDNFNDVGVPEEINHATCLVRYYNDINSELNKQITPIAT